MPSLHPSMVLGALLEAQLSGERVAVLGDSTVGLAERVASASRRRVSAFDPDPKRTATAMARSTRSGGQLVSFVVLDADLEGQQRSFDVVLVPDMAAFDDPSSVVATAQELLTGRGLAVFACRASSVDEREEEEDGSQRAHAAVDSALDYYDFYDAVAAEFASVRMLGRAPFFGFTVADFAAEGEPAVSIDSTLVEANEQPDLFVAVASHRPVDLEPYTLVQVPLAAGLRWLNHEPPAAPTPDQDAELAEAQLRIAEITRELDQLHEKQRREARLAEQRRSAATAASTRAAELETAVEERHAEVRRAERRVAELERALQQHKGRAAEREQDVSAARRRQSELEQQLRERDQRQADLEGALASIAEREADLESRLAARETAHEAELEVALSSIAEREADLESRLAAHEAAQQAEPPPDEAAEPADAQSVQAFEFQLAELRKTLAATRNERDALQKRAERTEQLEQELQAAQAGREQAESQLAQLSGNDADALEAETHAAEIAELERSLRERGRLVVELEAQGREAARVGRELLRQLYVAQHPADAAATALRDDAALDREVGDEPSGGGVPATATPSGSAKAAADGAASSGATDDAPRIAQLQLELELLAQKCSAYQADLEAANWTIQGLRQQPPVSSDESTSDVVKLEDALEAARREVAQLTAQLRAGRRDRSRDDHGTDRGVS